MDNNKIFYIAIDYNKIQNFVASGPYNTYESYILNPTGEIVKSDTRRDERLAQQVQTALEESTAKVIGPEGEELTQEDHSQAIAAALYAAGPTSNELGFFYLSDLVDVILENIQLELEYLEAQYSNPDRKKDKTTKFPQENPDKIDAKLWEKRTKDLQKFKNNFKRFRVLLGPIELIHHKKTDSKYVESVNLGDIPISVKYFMEWVTGKVFQKDEVFYSLSTFLNQIMNNLVTNFLNNRKCFYFDIKQKVRVNQAAITSYSPAENSSNNVHVDEVTSLMLKKAKLMKKKNYTGSPTRLNFSDAIVKDYMGFNADNTFKTDREGNIIGARPLLNVSGRPNEDSSNYAPLSHEINYMTFYASRVAATGAPNREKDLKKGIFHYLLGQENGILKEIKLQKTQTKGLAEARFEMDGYDGLEQLRVVYDLDIQTYANVNAFPGTYIYVPPGGLDPSWRRYNFTDTNLRSLGIGGYYMIIRSTHSFAAGQANSTIYAKWVNSLESDYPPSEGGSPASEEAEESKCSVASTTRLQELERS